MEWRHTDVNLLWRVPKKIFIIFLEFEKIENIAPELKNKNCKRKCTICYIERDIRETDFCLPESNEVHKKATPTGQT